MLTKTVKGNIAMGVSKFCSGLNANALRYLLPHWMSGWSGVAIRLVFGSAFFWGASVVTRTTDRPPLRDKLIMLSLGLLMFGYMLGLLLGLTYTTPISSSIFMATEPIWVFILSMIFLHERATWMKIIGLALGLVGALVIVMTQHSSDLASNPLLGDLYSLMGALLYSVYLITSAGYLHKYSSITVSKWAFLGGAIPAVITALAIGWYAPVLTQKLFSTPMLVLLFVLFFPTAISYLLLDIGLDNLSPTVVALYSNVILIVSTVASYILGQDRFDWFQILAIVLIIASVYYMEVAESKPITPPSKAPTPAKN